MNEEELLNLISQGEGETLEFKSSFDAEVYEAVAAFSNARRDIIFLLLFYASENLLKEAL